MLDTKLVLLYLFIKYKKDWDKTYAHIKNKKPCPSETVMQEFLTKKKIVKSNWVSLLDDDYPEILKRIRKPPFVIEKNSEHFRHICEIERIYFEHRHTDNYEA